MKSFIRNAGLFLVLLASVLQARFPATAVDSCQAWNDLAHRRNIGRLTLTIGKDYTVMRRHKGQYLIKITSPSSLTQRWVDQRCLQPKKSIRQGSQAVIHRPTQRTQSTFSSLLILSWHNSFCETHSHRKECRPLFNYGTNHLVLHGLWPQPPSRVYCGIPPELIAKDKAHRWRALPVPPLPPSLHKELLRVMPGTLSGLERHEWIKHGSCYDSDPVRYFSDAVALTESVDRSMVGEYLRANVGGKIRLADLRKIFEKSFGKRMGNRLIMECRRGLLSELRISLHGKGSDLRKLLPPAKALKGGCREAIVDGPGRYKKR